MSTKAERNQFIKDKVFYVLTEDQLDKELKAKGWKAEDVILIDDTGAVIHKDDKDEFIKLFTDETIKNTVTLHHLK